MKLRFGTFLAPNLVSTYEFVAGYCGAKLGIETELVVGESLDQFGSGELDAGFICGLPYVHLAPHVELLAAPILQGERYGGRAIYFSDVIVRADSPFRSFEDLRGGSWAYNEPMSHSGYNVVRHHLLELGETDGFFGRVIAAGWHQTSIQWVAEGKVDASAIDTHVLAVELRNNSGLAQQLRVIDTLGPSTIQPVVSSATLDEGLKNELREALIGMADDPAAAAALNRGLIARFAPITDSDYDDIRNMVNAAERASFLRIR